MPKARGAGAPWFARQTRRYIAVLVWPDRRQTMAKTRVDVLRWLAAPVLALLAVLLAQALLFNVSVALIIAIRGLPWGTASGPRRRLLHSSWARHSSAWPPALPPVTSAASRWPPSVPCSYGVVGSRSAPSLAATSRG